MKTNSNKSTAELTTVFSSDRTFPHGVKRTEGTETKLMWSLQETSDQGSSSEASRLDSGAMKEGPVVLMSPDSPCSE